MGYMFAMGPCGACGKVFSYNPEKVPSFRRTPESLREAICRECVEAANPMRKERGLPEIEILPGAYEAEEVA